MKQHITSLKGNRFYFFTLTISILLGISFVYTTYRLVENKESKILLAQAETLASVIDITTLDALTISDTDVFLPEYIDLKNKLTAVRTSNDKIRFVYIVTEIDGGYYFIADSEAPYSPDYSPPGQEYTEAPPKLKIALLSGKALLEGPYKDRWGEWFSAFAPIRSPSGKAIALVGIDTNARDHYSTIYLATGFAFVLSLLLISFIFQLLRSRRKERSIALLREEFMGLAAHELRSPLTAISWTLSELKDNGALPVSEKKLITEAHDTTIRLTEHINSLLDLIKIEHVKFNDRGFSSVSILPLIEDISTHLENILKDTYGVKTSILSPKSDVHVIGNETLLSYAFSNILANAMKYSNRGDVVQIIVKEKPKTISIEIIDTGIGIPKEAQKYIFEGFYRARNAVSSGIEGSGFGLYVTKKIILLHHGTIVCESQETGGTTFRIELNKI